jgi:hypothetical protein
MCVHARKRRSPRGQYTSSENALKTCHYTETVVLVPLFHNYYSRINSELLFCDGLRRGLAHLIPHKYEYESENDF